MIYCYCSVAKSNPTLWPHGLKYTRLPCPSLSPRVGSNSWLDSQWCYLTILSSAAHFFCLPSFSVSVSFSMSQLFTSGGQSIRTPASVLPMKIQGWYPLGVTSGMIYIYIYIWLNKYDNLKFRSILQQAKRNSTGTKKENSTKKNELDPTYFEKIQKEWTRERLAKEKLPKHIKNHFWFL